MKYFALLCLIYFRQQDEFRVNSEHVIYHDHFRSVYWYFFSLT